MRTKKYWQDLSEQHSRDLQEARNLRDLKDQALKFLLESPDTYRVELTDEFNCFGPNRTVFEYVDQHGKYHRHKRPVKRDALEVVSTNAETAVFKFETVKGKYTYWVLNKAEETVAEIPEALICDKGAKICENREDFICLIKT